MFDPQFFGVQHHTRIGLALFMPIKWVAKDRMPKRQHVQTQLVGSPCLGGQSDPRGLALIL